MVESRNSKKTLKIYPFLEWGNELVLAIRPLYVPNLDGCDKRPIPAIAYKGDFSHERNIPFFYGRTKGELARKIYNFPKS